MAISLGKRKRDATRSRPQQQQQQQQLRRSDADAQDEDEAARLLFRRAFEAKFQALDEAPVKILRKVELIEIEEEDDQSVESEWSGLSDTEDLADTVEVVDHGRKETTDADLGELEKLHKKAFMSSKPPKSEMNITKPSKVAISNGNAEDTAEQANLKNDLALQRLLKESHLLEPTTTERASFNVEGKGRLKALDMRIRDLGAKSSALEQEKMPMAQRKGIAEKKVQRETSRRKEAAANGIILEKARNTMKIQKRRERNIGGPTVGKFQRGALKLSARDVKDIVGGGGGGRKGRR